MTSDALALGLAVQARLREILAITAHSRTLLPALARHMLARCERAMTLWSHSDMGADHCESCSVAVGEVRAMAQSLGVEDAKP